MAQHLKFLFLEPFYGGSHREFAEGLISHSRHQMDLVTMPDRFWKWRMRGAALHFIKKIPSLESYDGLMVTGLMSLSDFKTLYLGVNGTCPPALVYFHESQLTYPLAPGEQMDYQFGFTDILTALAADRVLFNSQTHLDAFFTKLPGFLKMMPDYRPKWVVDAIRKKTNVLHPGCRFPVKASGHRNWPKARPPLIIWNHRWEFDKNPDAFFRALDTMLAIGKEFRLALLGETGQEMQPAFVEARKRFGHRIVRFGYAESREEYIGWLEKGDIVVSTALQENFGIAMVEAIRYGCFPLLPDRLSYPEIIPKEFHGQVLYQNQKDLENKLSQLIGGDENFQTVQNQLSQAMSNFAWEKLIGCYDEELERLFLEGNLF